MKQRGLTLVELMLALAVTAIVSMAIAGMLGAVSTGVSSRRDARAVVVRAHAAAARLAAYIAPSRCILAVSGPNVTLWFNDARQSNTVHATELRWLIFDADAGELVVQYVQCPDGWSEAACNLDDDEYPATSDWTSVLATYQGKGMIATRTLVDGLSSITVLTEQVNPRTSKVMSYDLGFETEVDVVTVTTTAGLTQHVQPAS